MPVATADLETVSTGLEVGNADGEHIPCCARSESCQKAVAMTAGQGFSDVTTSQACDDAPQGGTGFRDDQSLLSYRLRRFRALAHSVTPATVVPRPRSSTHDFAA
jgi:hypothetical protein